MHVVEANLIGDSEFMYGREFRTAKKSDETHMQREIRCWREKCWVESSNGSESALFINPFAIKNALESAGRWLSMSIPGEPKKTFTKRITAGVMVIDRPPMMIRNGVGEVRATLDNLEEEIGDEHLHALGQDGNLEVLLISVPSRGTRGGGSKVKRAFPIIRNWKSPIRIIVLDDMITEDVMQKHLATAGIFVGLGAMRVEGGGINGRFHIEDWTWQETEM